RGRAVLFSPHPELGDLWRKYVAFDGYVRRYLPIRGRAVMADTLAHYAPLDSPCFRLVLNAIHALAPSARGERRAAARQSAPLAPARYGTQARGRLRRLLSRLRSDVRSELARNVGRGLDRRLGDGMPLLTGALKALGRAPRDRAGELCAAWDHLAAAGMARQIWAARRNGKMADELLEVELVASLYESFAGLARVTRASEEAAAR
ncbi:MAG: hypothetical protein HY246_08705, partial [Proteobacteria bacterium]|nr:hypothetical protein [Pseudomonadota bacterium]